MFSMKSWPLICFLGCSLTLLGCGRENGAESGQDVITSAQPPLPTKMVTLVGPQGQELRVLAEVADEETERQTGMMFRPTLVSGTGMLFVFPQAGRLSFWMKNTLIPLDILFFREGRLLAVVPWAKPHDETPLGPKDPADKVLEVPGGWAAANQVSAGWTLREH